MLLNFLGDPIEEVTVRDLIGTNRKGTSAINIIMLNASLPKIKAELQHWSLAKLQKFLESKRQPCIVAVKTNLLPYWKGKAGRHAVVIHGFDDKRVFINDPYYKDKEFRVKIKAFMAAWSALGNIAITIERR